MTGESELRLYGKGSSTINVRLLQMIANDLNLKIDTMQLWFNVVNVVVHVDTEKKEGRYLFSDVIVLFYNAFELYYYIMNKHLDFVTKRLIG